jgi:exosortase
MNCTQVIAAPARDLIEDRSPLSAWRISVVVLLLGAIYYDTLARLAADWWQDPNFSHGFFVPLFSAFIVWRSRERLRRIPLRPSYWGMAVIVAAILAFIAGTLAAELFLARSSFVLMIAGLLIYLLGFGVFRALVFPWALLFFMIPVPAIILNQMTFPLQLLASRLASGILSVLSIPVLREGNVIRLPAMPLEVAEACSGLRSLMSLATLAIIYGYFAEPRRIVRFILALAAVPIAVLTNAMRIVGTGVTVEYWDPQKAVGFFHEFSGWLMFLTALLLLLGFHRIFRVATHSEEVH